MNHLISRDGSRVPAPTYNGTVVHPYWTTAVLTNSFHGPSTELTFIYSTGQSWTCPHGVGVHSHRLHTAWVFVSALLLLYRQHPLRGLPMLWFAFINNHPCDFIFYPIGDLFADSVIFFQKISIYLLSFFLRLTFTTQCPNNLTSTAVFHEANTKSNILQGLE